jgi:hypothetical protein
MHALVPTAVQASQSTQDTRVHVRNKQALSNERCVAAWWSITSTTKPVQPSRRWLVAEQGLPVLPQPQRGAEGLP